MDSNSRDPKPLSVVFALQLLPPSAPGSDRWVHLSTNGNREENMTSNVLHVQQRGHLKKSYRFDYVNNYFEFREKSVNASPSSSKEDHRHSRGATMIEKTVEWLRPKLLNWIFDPKKDSQGGILFNIMPNSRPGECLFGLPNTKENEGRCEVSLSPKLATSFVGQARMTHNKFRRNFRGQNEELNVKSEVSIACYSMCAYQKPGELVEHGIVDLLDPENLNASSARRKLIFVPKNDFHEAYIQDLIEADFDLNFEGDTRRITTQVERLLATAAASRQNVGKDERKFLGAGWTVVATVVTLRSMSGVQGQDVSVGQPDKKTLHRTSNRTMHFVELEKDITSGSVAAFLPNGMKSHSWVQQIIERNVNRNGEIHPLRQLLEPVLANSSSSPWIGVVANLEKDLYQSSQTAHVFGPDNSNMITGVLSFLEHLGLPQRTSAASRDVHDKGDHGIKLTKHKGTNVTFSSSIDVTNDLVEVKVDDQRSENERALGLDIHERGALSDGEDDATVFRPYFERDMRDAALETAATTQQHLAEAIRSQQEQTIEMEAKLRVQMKERDESHQTQVESLKQERLDLENKLKAKELECDKLKRNLEISQVAVQKSKKAHASLTKLHKEKLEEADSSIAEVMKRLKDANCEKDGINDVHQDMYAKWDAERFSLNARIASLERQLLQQVNAIKDATNASNSKQMNGIAQNSPSSQARHIDGLLRAEESAIAIAGLDRKPGDEVEYHNAILATRETARNFKDTSNAINDTEDKKSDAKADIQSPEGKNIVARKIKRTSSPATVARRRLNYQNRVSCEQDADDSVSELKGSSAFLQVNLEAKAGNNAEENSVLRHQIRRSLFAVHSEEAAAFELENELKREREHQSDLVGNFRQLVEVELDNTLDEVVAAFESDCESTKTHVQELHTKLVGRIESLERCNEDLQSEKQKLLADLDESKAHAERMSNFSSDADKKISDLILTMSSNMENLKETETERDEAIDKCKQLQQDLTISQQQCIELRRVIYSAMPQSQAAQQMMSNKTKISVSKPFTRSKSLSSQDLEAAGIDRYLIQAAVRDTNAEVLEYMAATPDIGSPTGRKKTSTSAPLSPDDFLHRRLEDEEESLAGLQNLMSAIQKGSLPSTDNKGVAKDPISVSPDALFSGKSRLQTSRSSPIPQTEIEEIRHRIRSAAYIMGGADYANLFDHIDKNHNGTLDYDEFHSVVRRVLHLSSQSLSDAHVRKAFTLIDVDTNHKVSVDEIVAFANGGSGWRGYHGDEHQGRSPVRQLRSPTKSPEQPIRSTRPIAKQPWWNAQRNNHMPKKDIESIRAQVAGKVYELSREGDIESFFGSFSKDQSETLNPDDFHKIIRDKLHFTPNDMPDTHVAVVFHSIDTDLSGKVSLNEFITYVREYLGDDDANRPGSFQPRGSSPPPKQRRKLHAPKYVAPQPKHTAKSVAEQPYWRAQRGKSFSKKKLEKIRHHLYSAAYRYAGKDYAGLFKHLDKDHNGYLDPDEFQSFMRRILRLPPRIVSDADIATVFQMIDCDNTETVEIEEIIAFAHQGIGWHGYDGTRETDYGNESYDPNAADKLKIVERDTISKTEIEEIRHRIRSAAYKMGGADYANLFDHIDKNHNGTLDYDEFHSVVRRVLHLSSQSLSDAHVRKAFTLIDVDTNHKVSVDEIVAFANGGSGWRGYESKNDNIA